jgi:hypothetical protein
VSPFFAQWAVLSVAPRRETITELKAALASSISTCPHCKQIVYLLGILGLIVHAYRAILVLPLHLCLRCAHFFCGAYIHDLSWVLASDGRRRYLRFKPSRNYRSSDSSCKLTGDIEGDTPFIIGLCRCMPFASAMVPNLACQDLAVIAQRVYHRICARDSIANDISPDIHVAKRQRLR